MFGKCDTSCKDCVELALKVIFVAVFTYGVMSLTCCKQTCSSSQCGKAGAQVQKQCGSNCSKACCKN